MSRLPIHLALTFSLGLLSACSDRVVFMQPKFQMGPNGANSLVVTPDGEVVESGKLSVSIRGFLDTLSKKRRVLATLADVEKVVVTVTASGQEFSQTVDKSAINAGATTATFTGIPVGAATVTMKAYNASNQLIGQASKSATVSAGQTTNVDIQLQLDPTYTQPAPGGGGTTTGGITANGTIIDGVVINGPPPPASGTLLGVYQLDFPPTDLALDSAGGLWVSNDGTTKHLSKFSGDGTFLSHVDGGHAFGTYEIAFDSAGHMWSGGYMGLVKRDGAIQKVHETAYNGHLAGLAVAPDDAVWTLWASLSGDGTSTLAKFGADGAEQVTLALGASPPGRPPAIAVDGQGQAWVLRASEANGTTTSSLSRYAASGQLIATHDLPAGFHAVGLKADANDRLWVCGLDQVLQIGQDGAVLGTFSAGQAAVDLAFDAAGRAWVLSGTSVYKLAPDGAVLGQYDLPPASDSYDGVPERIVVGPSGVWAIDLEGMKLFRLAP